MAKGSRPGGDGYRRLAQTFRALDLHTVCEEARCPNVGECWHSGTATIMLLGEVCTRGCRFCAVATGNPRGVLDIREPEHVARAIAVLGLTYVVLTMVNRDDLLDGGAEHVTRTVRRLHALRPDIHVEALVGDFQGHLDSVDAVVAAEPEVFAHNVETVRRMTRLVRDVRSGYEQSLSVLTHARSAGGARLLTKSSIMVGLGETDDEVVETMCDLRAAGVDIVTIGQYLRPSPRHHEVVRFVEPATFDAYAKAAREMGFRYAACGPLVRSSHRAAEVFLSSLFRKSNAPGEATNVADAEWVTVELAKRVVSARREAARVASMIGVTHENSEPTSVAGQLNISAASGGPHVGQLLEPIGDASFAQDNHIIGDARLLSPSALVRRP